MIEVAEAIALVGQHASAKPPQSVALADTLGLMLAQDIQSDVDSPPHDKSMVDGFAVISGDLASGQAELHILEEVTAGKVPTHTVQSGSTTRIMTGAPIPAGADAVVMVERTEAVAGNEARVRIQDEPVPGQHIMTRATSMSEGEVVLRAGKKIRPLEIGLMAEVGRTEIMATPQPAVAVLATGNELVPAHQRPGAGHIRNSNGPMICALAERAEATPVDLGIARDNEQDLRRLIEEGLQQDVLVLSGGVSAGVLDIVPNVLADLGVRQVFHRVNLKPGKPIWFGCWSQGETKKLVFGLPGNPVSSLVCFEIFVRPAINVLSGRRADQPVSFEACLTKQHQQRGNRPTYWPSALRPAGEQVGVEPLDWRGSADLRALARADCLAFFPGGDALYEAGQQVTAYHL